MSDQPAERVTLLYLGVREWEHGKSLRHLWYDLTGIDNDGSPLKDDHQPQGNGRMTRHDH